MAAASPEAADAPEPVTSEEAQPQTQTAKPATVAVAAPDQGEVARLKEDNSLLMDEMKSLQDEIQSLRGEFQQLHTHFDDLRQQLGG